MANLADAIAKALAPIEAESRSLSWAKERPWRVTSHAWSEHGLLTVDLHDLSTRLAQRAVRALLDPPIADLVAVQWITGRGRHAIAQRSALRDAVHDEIARLRRHDWIVRAAGPGRIVVVLDPAHAPPRLRGELGLGFWMMALVFAAVAVVYAPLVGVPLAAVATIVLLARAWRDWRAIRGQEDEDAR